jgi:hypothetical protein
MHGILVFRSKSWFIATVQSIYFGYAYTLVMFIPFLLEEFIVLTMQINCHVRKQKF